MHEHPKALYRKGSRLEWEGRRLDLRVVHSPEEEIEAKAEGWREAHHIDAPVEKPKRKK